jgi:hypothetical protein
VVGPSGDICCTHAARILVGSSRIATELAEEYAMQTPIAISVAATVQKSPDWVKYTAKATFLALFIKGTVWAGASWLALRGFGAL